MTDETLDDEAEFEEEGQKDLDYHPELVDDLSPYDELDGFAYDPDVTVDPAAWLRFSNEAKRLLVAAYHRRTGREIADGDARVRHGMLHVAVENQLALGEMPAAERLVARFEAAGASRHAAVHAIAEELGRIAAALIEDPESVDADAYEAALDRIEPG